MGNTQTVPSDSNEDSSRYVTGDSSNNAVEHRAAHTADQTRRRATMAFGTSSVIPVDDHTRMITSIASTPSAARSRRVSIEFMEHDAYHHRRTITLPSSPATMAHQLVNRTNSLDDNSHHHQYHDQREEMESFVVHRELTNNDNGTTPLLTSKPMPIRQRRELPVTTDLLDSDDIRVTGAVNTTNITDGVGSSNRNRTGRHMLSTSLSAYPFVGSPLSYSELSGVGRSPASLTAMAQPIKFPSVEESGSQPVRPLVNRGRASTSPGVTRMRPVTSAPHISDIIGSNEKHGNRNTIQSIHNMPSSALSSNDNNSHQDDKQPEIFKATPEDHPSSTIENHVMNTRPLAISHTSSNTNTGTNINTSTTTPSLSSNNNQALLSTSINSSHINQQEIDVSADDLLTPTIITWNGGGHIVYVTGTFNRWRRKIKMLKSSPSDEDFTAVIQLPVGTHQLKFIVDDEWRCSGDLATAPDVNGNLVNYITVDPDILSNELDTLPIETNKESQTSYASSPDGSYTSERPAYLDLALQSHIIPGSNGAAIPSSALANEAASVRRMQPPTLPPHLDHVILNNATVSRDDDSALPAPHHVELNHLYACSIRDGVMAMATTKRYREKYITTVYYKPVFH